MLVHLVADLGTDDPALGRIAECLALGLPGTKVEAVSVAPGDTVSAGRRVAELALTQDAEDHLVAHELAVWGDDDQLCVGRTTTGALVIGRNVGWAWSFVVARLTGFCHMDVRARDIEHARDALPVAVVHAAKHHPHVVREALPRSVVPAPPQRVSVRVPQPTHHAGGAR